MLLVEHSLLFSQGLEVEGFNTLVFVFRPIALLYLLMLEAGETVNIQFFINYLQKFYTREYGRHWKRHNALTKLVSEVASLAMIIFNQLSY